MKKKIQSAEDKAKRNQKILLWVTLFAIVFVTIGNSVINSNNAKGYVSLACQKSAECMAAVNAEKEANAAAISANSSANFYEAKVAELSTEIASTRRKIADTKVQITELNTQIKATQRKLDSEQSALAELLVNMHFESDVEPIAVLAGAESISDLAERASRTEVAQQQIAAMASSIKDAKLKLEEDRAQVEALLAEQQAEEKELEDRKVEQQHLVEKFQNDAAAYEAQVLAAREAQRVAEKAYRDAHPEMFATTYYDGIDTYRSYIADWGGYSCPRDWDRYTTYVNGRKIGGLMCECVSYVGWKAYERYGIYLAYGNAYDWKWRAEANGFIADRTPSVGSIGWFYYGSGYGHVFWVESVNADGSIDVTDYNYNVDGRFTARKINAANVGSFYYIHVHN